jgi:23S rRNA pseudouridine1911/1915/1917 synthase
MPTESHHLTTPPEARNTRLDNFLKDHLASHGLTRSRIIAAIKSGHVLLDDATCVKPSTKLKPGQAIVITTQQPAQQAAPVSGNLSILYEDSHLLVLNKPPHLTVHPAPGVEEPTLVNYLVHDFPRIASLSKDRPGIVHRLDKDTSGLIVIALTEQARLAMAAAFADRIVYKEYLALVHGCPDEDSGEIEADIGRHPTIKTRMAVVTKGGRPARSAWRVVWRSPDRTFSLLRVRIFTGRTHQIRVHLRHLGFPIVGDSVYGGRSFDTSTRQGKLLAKLAKRQMLHAFNLRFSHPVTGKDLAFRQAVPKDFFRCLALLAKPVFRIGLTGMSGGGKSTVLRGLGEQGIPVWSADQAVGELYEPGQDGWDMLRHQFGDRFVPDDDAPVDKRALFAAMYADDGLRREVNSLIHPMVRHRMEEFFTAHADAPVVVAEVPLLAESGWGREEGFDLVVGVFCPDSVRLKNLEARGWSEEMQATMDSWQWSQKDKLQIADLVVNNSGDLAALQEKTRKLARVLRWLRRQRVKRLLRDMEGEGVLS